MYGGKISGRKEKGLKVNPIYQDSFNSHQPSGYSRRDHNGNTNGVYLEMYETFPPRKDRNANLASPKDITMVGLDKTVPALNGNLSDPEHKSQDIDQTSSKVLQPTLLGPGDDLQLNLSNTSRNNQTQNVTENQRSTSLKPDDFGHTGSHTEEILSDLRNMKLPKDDYALLGYHNGAYVHDDEVIKDAEDVKDADNINVSETVKDADNINVSETVKDADNINVSETEKDADNINDSETGQQESVAVCHSIDSSPSKSSISSDSSPKKKGKFVTQVSVHVIEYSENPAKSVKLESPDIETSKDSEITQSKSDVGNADPYDDILVVTQEENSSKPKVEIVKETETRKDVSCIDDRGLTDNEEDKLDTRNPEEVVIDIDSETKSSHVEVSEIHPSKEDKVIHIKSEVKSLSVQGSEIQSSKKDSSDSQSKSTNHTKKSALFSNKVKKKDKNNGSHDLPDGEPSETTLKSILANASPDVRTKVPNHSHTGTDSDMEIHEAKSVKFSQDTVFNENKPKKYKNERIDRMNLRNIYRGRISSDSAVAKLNPLFSDDLEAYDQDSLTDDEKVAYRLSLQKMMESNGKVKNANPDRARAEITNTADSG